ncbi:hypothetical protein Csp2054_00770 [Curtobacterium sp. 'Ferrero']|uniref:PLDc N-terminal domain-containing protein n=1 Tax=Curtobacterium sp. 'Ferrero' TaxID=2033654 RepID=UPI000BCA04E3|nr:PLDc N-terminal domain-containing protein [Curtobacterium sp. 'Ferrero']PCN49754.1 hypothetical protein Csp2054_00770 [Curtobacterium sp. 'Ferrero']
MESSNPVIPMSYDLIWGALTVVMFALLVAALISIGRHAAEMGVIVALVWAVVAIVMPFLGPAAWFFVGRRQSGSASRRGVSTS